MVTIRKRIGKNGVSWQIDYFDPNGKRVRKSFKKKKDAEFKEIRQRDQLRSQYVVCDSKGRRFKEVRKSFMASLRKAEIEDFEFHDLRHTFASHFIMRRGSIKELQEILGHKTTAMTMRYAHLSQEHKKKAINRLNGLTRPQNSPKLPVTKVSHFKN